MPPLPASDLAPPLSPDKGDFANPAPRFVNRVRHLPGLPIYLAASLAAVVFLTASGGFGSASMPLPTRLLFWSMLIGFNTIAWVLWLSWRVRDNGGWWPAVLLGIPLLNLPLPLEIYAALRVIGVDAPIQWHWSWIRAMTISLVLLLLLVMAIRSRQTDAPASPVPRGKLWRAGVGEPSALAAEDHYCRAYRTDGSSELLHGRFSDLVGELAHLDGAVVRRGQWVAATAVDRVERDGRRWQLRLKDGRAVPVSSSAVPELRRRGWIGGATKATERVANPAAIA